MDGIQDALDDPRYRFVIVPGPARTGKSLGGENHIVKRFRNGPKTDVIVYLPSSSDIDSYADKEFGDLFSEALNPELAAQIGKRPTDNKRELKRLGRHVIQLLPANKSTVRQKQAPFIWASEVDGYTRIKPHAVKQLIAIRGRAYGNQFKAYMESHADAGWFGIAGEWKLSTRGLWYWPCARCGAWGSPHPLAPKGLYMPLAYDRQDSLPMDEMLDLITQTSGLRCPHCGKLSLEADKPAMLDAGRWVFAGQIIQPNGNWSGDVIDSDSAGFWIHGTMSPFVSMGELAREYVAALVMFERTRKSEKLREVTAKSLGPVYEGGTGSGLVAADLRARKGPDEDSFAVGTFPDRVMFATVAVDVGKRMFDISLRGWDLEARSWLTERVTITKRRWPDGIERDIRPAERIADWDVLEPLLDRIIPIIGTDYGLPIAAMAVDTGGAGHVDGDDVQSGVTWKAREWARRMARKGKSWAGWQRVRLIKGARSQTAPELAVAPRKVSKDERGRPTRPELDEWDLGVHRLKQQSIEWLAVEDHGPGQCYFAEGLPASTFDEFLAEKFIDGEWVRTGPNESLDLFGYENAARMMLRPDRAEIQWDDPARRPIWARPVSLDEQVESAGDDRPAPRKKPALSRMAALNRR